MEAATVALSGLGIREWLFIWADLQPGDQAAQGMTAYVRWSLGSRRTTRCDCDQQGTMCASCFGGGGCTSHSSWWLNGRRGGLTARVSLKGLGWHAIGWPVVTLQTLMASQAVRAAIVHSPTPPHPTPTPPLLAPTRGVHMGLLDACREEVWFPAHDAATPSPHPTPANLVYSDPPQRNANQPGLGSLAHMSAAGGDDTWDMSDGRGSRAGASIINRRRAPLEGRGSFFFPYSSYSARAGEYFLKLLLLLLLLLLSFGCAQESTSSTRRSFPTTS